jgi:hypothetical protein
VDSVKNAKGVFNDSFCQTIRCGVTAIHYGGIVTDELDRFLIKIMDIFISISEKLMKEPNKCNLLMVRTGIILLQIALK